MSDGAADNQPPQTLHAGRHVALVRRGHWEYVTRHKISGIVGIVAVTDSGNMILVEQYRPPVGACVVEIPAGLAGDIAGQEGEDLSIAAARELEEETGYRAARIERLTAGAASAGITDEIITLFRATGLTKVAAGGGDAHESITVHEVPLAGVRDWLEAQASAGKVIDLKVWGALYFAGCASG